MARQLRSGGDGPGVRAALIEREREHNRRSALRASSGYARLRLALLEAGEPFELAGWQLPRPLRPSDVAPNDRLRLERDGNLTVTHRAARR